MAVGIYRKGKPNYYATFGYRDVKNELPVTERTVFPICSLTKLFVAMTVGELIDSPSNNVTWQTRLVDILPGFDIQDPFLRQMTIQDALSHQTGMSRGNWYLGSNNNMIVAHEDSLKFLGDQVPIRELRQAFEYNNLGYELAGLAIDKLSDSSWAQLVADDFLSPWNMTRTWTRRPPPLTEGVSKAYNVLDNGSSVEIHTVQAGDGSFGGSSGGMFSCIEDLLKAYGTIMSAIECRREKENYYNPSTQQNSIKQATAIFSAKIPMAQPTVREASYAMGLARVELPGPMGHIGVNPSLLPGGRMPTVARGSSSKLVFYHQGSFPGAFSAIAMIPELNIAVGVLSNAMGLNDCPDWIIQLIVEEILGSPERNDYIAAARRSAAVTLDWYPRTLADLEKTRTADEVGPARPVREYVGTYWNRKRYAKIEVSLATDGTLAWALQGLDSEKYTLTHYGGDAFHWLHPRNYLVSRGRWVDEPASFWVLKFSRHANSGRVASVNWVHDADIPAGEDFFREEQ